MRDYNIYEVKEILKSCNSFDLKTTGHVMDRWFERDFSLDYISNCLLEKVPLGINKTSENRFLLIYPHNLKKSKDFYVVIEIDDYKNIEIITVYSFSKRRENVSIKDNSFEVEYRYDYSSDILGIKVKRDFIYCETVEMSDGVLLDFDVNNIPTALEILDASKRLNVPKSSLKNIIFFKMKVSIDEDSIKLNAVFVLLIQNIKEKPILESFAQNDLNLPSLETELVIA